MDNLNAKGTILFVDDEQVVLDVGALMLDRLGYKVLQATDGMEAEQIFSDNIDEINLVILDMLLPDEKGSDICKRLREINPDVKVLHTSGLGGTQSGNGLECGCKGFLQKPFKIEALSTSLKDLMENTT